MTKKIISLVLIAAMMLTMIPASVFATDTIDTYLEFNGFPTTWVNEHADFTITAKDGVTAMSVNGTAIEEVGGTQGGGVISSDGTPYVKYKALSYDEETGVLNIGAFIGNIKSGKGHGAALFTFKYDADNWAPYDLYCEEELTLIDDDMHTFEDCFVLPYSSKDKAAYMISDEQAAKCSKITLETSETGADLDFENGIACVTWYTNAAELDATEYEIPVLRFALVKKGSAAITSDTITQPELSEINKNLSVLDRNVSSSTQLEDVSNDVIYTSSKNNLEYVVEALDGTMYGCTPSVPGTFEYTGNTADADEFVVNITANGTSYSKTYEVMVDTVKPTLTVEPEETDDPVQEVTFTIDAKDDKSGIKEVLVNDISITGTEYKVTAPGVYTFKAIDNAGNESDVVTRNVTIDTDAPFIEVTGNATTWTNDDVVLTINAEEGATVTISKDDGEAKDITGKTTYTVTENGTYTFTATDKAGNAATPVEVVVDKIDKEDPELTATPDITTLTNGDVVITIDTEAGATVTVSKDSGEAEAVEGTTYTATENGTYTFVAADEAGNTAEKVVTVGNIDKIAPSLTVTPDITTPTNGDVVITIATEAGATVTVSKDNGTPETVTGTTYTATKNGTYTFVATDAAGNTTPKDVVVNNIDKDELTLTITGKPDSWTNEDVVLSVTTNKTAEITVSKNGGTAEIITGATYKITENGKYEFVATDAAGNTDSETYTLDYIDKTAPSLSVSAAPIAAVKSHTFTFEASDEESKINKVTVSNNGGTEQDIDGNEYVATADGTYLFTAYDNAGNKTEVTRVIAEGIIDNTAPKITVSGAPSGWTNKDVTLSVTTDETATVVVYKDGEEIATVSGTSYVATETGVYKFVATDIAGNVSDPEECEIKIDKIKPTLELSSALPEGWNSPYEISVNFGDEGGSQMASLTVNGEEFTGTFEATENIDYVVILTDGAGNSTELPISVRNIDDVKPTISNISGLPDTWVKDFNLTFTVADNETGVQFVTVNGEAANVANGVATYTVTENGDLEIEVIDRAGNSETQTVSNTGFVDDEVPTVEEPDVPSEPCQDYTFIITATDSQSGVDRVTVNGVPATRNGDVWEFYIESNGSYEIKAYDNVGRESEAVTVTVDKIDNDKPGISFPGFEDVWTNEDVEIAIAVDKEIVSLAVSKDGGEAEDITGETSYTVTENGEYAFTATDAAGNVGTNKIVVEKIDKEEPEISVTGKPDGLVKEFTAIITATDTQSDVTVTVALDGDEAVTVSGNTYPVISDGEYVFTATDKAGNTNSYTLDVDNIDNEAPALDINYDNTFAKEVNITVSYSDNKSDNSNITVTVNDEPLSGTNFTATENGPYTFKAVDEAGNETTVSVTVTNIDKEGPTVALNDAPSDWTNSFTLSITAEDSKSGVDKILVNDEVIDGTTYDVPANGTYKVVAIDKLGNESEPKEITINKLDKELPTIEVSEAPAEWTKEYTFTITAEDLLSGVKEVTVNGIKVDGNTYTVTANGEYKFAVTDNAGNTADKTVSVDKIDENAPVFSGDIVATENTADTITVSLPQATDDSGVAVTYELYLDGEKVEAYAGEATYTFTDLTIATHYTVKLVAADIVGRTSEIVFETETEGLGKIEASFDLSALDVSAEDLNMNVYLGEKVLPVGNDGKVVFESVAEGTYTLTFKAAGFFTVAKAEIVVKNSETTTVNFKNDELIAGDTTGDGTIDIYDLNAVASAFAESYDGETGLIYDFNRDGKVNAKDIVILVTNYNKTQAE